MTAHTSTMFRSRGSSSSSFAFDLGEAVTQVFAFVGKRGSGKTYAAGKLAEDLILSGHQVIVVDVVGTWWGLRAGADGRPEGGLDIAILGGEHGDIPLADGTGDLVARALADHSTSAVLDLSSFRKGARVSFLTAWAEEFFHRKMANRTPVHVVLEEAHTLAPQRIHKGQERMYGAIEDIVRLGRNYGIGVSMLDQRPQSVNKEVLNQAEVLCAFQLVGAQERDAVRRWAESKELAGVKDAFSDLSRLPAGECILWSPEWLDVLGRAAVAAKRTFDASATPGTKSSSSAATTMRKLDLAELQKVLEAEAAKKADKKTSGRESTSRHERSEPVVIEVKDTIARLDELHAENERLRGEHKSFMNWLDVAEPWIKNVRYTLLAHRSLLEALVGNLQAVIDDINPTLTVLKQTIAVGDAVHASAIQPPPARASRGTIARDDQPPPARASRGASELVKGDRLKHAILSALHQFGPLSRKQVLMFTGYASGGGPNTAFADLIAGEFVAVGNFGSGRSNDLQIVGRGEQWLRAHGGPRDLPTDVDLRAAILRERLPSTLEQGMFAQIEAAYPNEIARARVLELAGYSAGGGPNTAFRMLVDRGYIEKTRPGYVRAAHELYATGKRPQIQQYLYDRAHPTT